MSSIKVSGGQDSNNLELGLHYTVVNQDEAEDQKLGGASMSLWDIDRHDRGEYAHTFCTILFTGYSYGVIGEHTTSTEGARLIV